MFRIYWGFVGLSNMRVPYSGALVIRNLSAFGSFRISGVGASSTGCRIKD